MQQPEARPQIIDNPYLLVIFLNNEPEVDGCNFSLVINEDGDVVLLDYPGMRVSKLRLDDHEQVDDRGFGLGIKVFFLILVNLEQFVDETLISLKVFSCLLYTSPSPRDQRGSRMPSSA